MHMVCCRDSCLWLLTLLPEKTRGKYVGKAYQYSIFSYFLPFYNTLTTKATRFYKKR